eukprot:g4414.t1
MVQVKTVLICLLAFLGTLFGVVLILMFAALEDTRVSDVWDRIFGGHKSDKPFTLPKREQPSPTPEELGDVESHKEWFAASGRNLRFHSAVLVAGSRGYQNYRHQADICHAFQVLKKGGLDPDRIITFVYNDIAYNGNNPYPGRIFNRPGGTDVYHGCAKDYTGTDVNRDVLFAVLKGDSRAVRGIGSGRVLSVNSEQRVFFAYSDHGSVGSIGMPFGPSIYANELNAVLQSMISNKAFKEMVFYLESCNSGSMFAGFYTRWQKSIFIATASSSYESSYATYCPYEDTFEPIIPNATYVGACLGDLFTVSWLEDTNKIDRAEQLIADQIRRVQKRTSDYGTFRAGSHLTQFGDSDGVIRREVVGNFLSYYSAPSGWTRSDVIQLFDSYDYKLNKNKKDNEEEEEESERKASNGYDQWTADLIGMYRQNLDNERSENEVIFLRELESRRNVDKAIRTMLESLIKLGVLPKDTSVQRFAQELIPRDGASSIDDQNIQVVNDWDCLKQMVSVWEESCGELTDYSRQYTRTFVNLCNALVTPSSVRRSVSDSCVSIST